MERYDEFGEIIKPTPKPIIYERKLDIGQQHRIHETKDLFESECYLCQKAVNKQSHWADEAPTT